MPHSVFTFMDMVDKRAWDNSRFHFRSNHIAITSDEYADGEPKNPEVLSKLLFPEYSDKFKHFASTIGFAGRPGGPNFYINLTDNSRIHGPGGQKRYHLSEEADSCFAKIVHGKDMVAKMNDKIQQGEKLDVVIETVRWIKQKKQS